MIIVVASAMVASTILVRRNSRFFTVPRTWDSAMRMAMLFVMISMRGAPMSMAMMILGEDHRRTHFAAIKPPGMFELYRRVPETELLSHLNCGGQHVI